MTRKLALSLILVAVFAWAGPAAADDVISPNSVTVNSNAKFTYSGAGDVYEWCFKEHGSSSWVCGESDRHKFTKTGTGKVKVKVDMDSGEMTKTESVQVTDN